MLQTQKYPVERFMGRKIFLCRKYPAIQMRGHPVARKNGTVRIHQLVAYELFGDTIRGRSVHHKDRNRWNWAHENLELLTKEEHELRHGRKIF